MNSVGSIATSAHASKANLSGGAGINAADVSFMVIEDQEFQRVLMVHMLASLGAKDILEAADGHEALEAWKAHGRPINIIISDLDMPRMDGMEFIRHIAQDGAPVSMILASVHDRSLLASVGAMTEAYGITLLGTIEKPVTAMKLEALIALYKPSLNLKAAEPSITFSDQDLSSALADRLFEPVFQPKVDVATGIVKGAEALARWHHPKLGILGPQAFIPALESSRRIDELTWIMLQKALKACRMWCDAGLDITVSVNLSLASITDVGLADRVTAMVKAHKLQPRQVTLEVTETIAMTDMVLTLENLARLRIKGFGLSIDDYGTGYSSMQQLSRIPFTELKIDQSFVMKAWENQSCRVILESSLDIAKKLGMSAVAEGVERRAEWDLLKSLGCSFAQGYFISRPMDAEQMIDWAAHWEPPA